MIGKKLITNLMAATLLISGLAGCASGENTSSDTDAKELEVHIGDQPSFYVLKLADELGYFEEEFEGTGVNIVVDNFVNQGPAIVESLTSEDLDLGVIGALPLVSADANNDNFVAISTVNYSTDGFKLVAGKDTDISSVKDFKGKKIAVKFSTNEHQMLLDLLNEEGLSTDDVEIVNMSTSDAIAALSSGDVDGTVLKGEDVKTVEDAGATAVADNSTTGTISNYLVGRKEFVEEHEDVVTGVLKALDKTAKWIDENEEEAIQKYSDITGTDYDSSKESLIARERKITIDDDKFTDTIQQSLDFSKEQKLIENSDLTVDDIVDTKYFKNSGLDN